MRFTIEKLKPPPGQKYCAKVLDRDLEMRPIDGVARIIQDDLQGTYNACFKEAGQKTCAYQS